MVFFVPPPRPPVSECMYALRQNKLLYKEGKIMQSAKKKMPTVVSFNVLSHAEATSLRLSSVAACVSSSPSSVCHKDSSSHRLSRCLCAAYFHTELGMERKSLYTHTHTHPQMYLCFVPVSAAQWVNINASLQPSHNALDQSHAVSAGSNITEQRAKNDKQSKALRILFLRAHHVRIKHN